MSSARWRILARYSIYWLYWYKSTNADAEGAVLLGYWQAWFAWSALFSFGGGPCVLAGTQFTCFTGTKVQILTLQAPQQTLLVLLGNASFCSTQFTCFTSFTSKKADILTQCRGRRSWFF
jgi:hypothetical protein